MGKSRSVFTGAGNGYGDRDKKNNKNIRKRLTKQKRLFKSGFDLYII